MEDEDEATTKRKSTQLPKMDWLIDQGIINIGDEVYLINHPEEIAVIVDARNVRYKDQIMSFNQYGCELTGWKAIQIYAFMKKVGGDKTLSKLREEKMKELGYHEGYLYPHDFPGHYVEQQYLPDKMVGTKYYIKDENCE